MRLAEFAALDRRTLEAAMEACADAGVDGGPETVPAATAEGELVTVRAVVPGTPTAAVLAFCRDRYEARRAEFGEAAGFATAIAWAFRLGHAAARFERRPDAH